MVINLDYKARALQKKIVRLDECELKKQYFLDENSLVKELAAALSNNELVEASDIMITIYNQNPWFFKKKENIELGLKLAESCLQDGDIAKALDWYESFLKEEPEHPEVYLGLGSVYMVLGDLEAAINYFLAGLDLNPGHVLLCYNACLLLQSIDEIGLAIEEVEIALEANPDNAMLQKLAGDLKFKDRSLLDEVLEHYKTAVFSMTHDEPQELLIQLLNNYSLALAENGDYTVAEKMLLESLNLEEKREDTLLNLSAFYGFYMENYDLAIMYAERVIEQNPDSGKAYHNLGLAYLAKDFWDRAQWYLYKAKKILPRDYLPINNALADLYAKKPKI